MPARLWVLAVVIAAISCGADAAKCEPLFLQDYANNFFSFHKHVNNPSLLCTSTRVSDMCGAKEAPTTKVFGCDYESCKMAFMEKIVSMCGEWGLRLKFGKQFFSFDLEESYSSNECLTNLHKSVSVNIHNAHAQNLYNFCNTARVEDFCGGPENQSSKLLRVVIATLGCRMSDCAKLFYGHMLRGCGNWGSETEVSQEYHANGQLGECDDFVDSAVNSILAGFGDPCKDTSESLVCGDKDGGADDKKRAELFNSLGCTPDKCNKSFSEIMTSKCAQWSKKLSPTEESKRASEEDSSASPKKAGKGSAAIGSKGDAPEKGDDEVLDLAERARTQKIRKVLQRSVSVERTAPSHPEDGGDGEDDEDDVDPGDY